MQLLPWLRAACLLKLAGATFLHKWDSDASSKRLLPVAAAAEHGGREAATAGNGSLLDLATAKLHDSGRGKEGGDFPDMLPPDRKLLGKLKYVLHGFHVDDIGVYLSTQSGLWGRRVTPEEFLAESPGDLTLRYRIASIFFTRRRWSQWLIGSIFRHQAEVAACPNVEEEVSQMQKLILSGPKFHVGAVLDFDLDRDGMAYTFDGRSQSRGGDLCSCTATLLSYVGEECISDSFKLALLRTLQEGADSKVAAVTANDGHPGIVWGIIIGVAVGLVAMCTACICACWNGSLRKHCCCP